MAYNAAIPTANQRIKDSQQPIQDNFAAIQTLINVNHGTFGSPDQGKHIFVTFPRQGAAPATGLTDVALYSILGPSSGNTELAFRNQNNGTSSIFTEAKKQQNGWTRLPSGILMAWGTATCSPTISINFALYNGVVFTTVYSVNASVQTINRHVSATIVGTSVTFVTDVNPTNIFFTVIGV